MSSLQLAQIPLKEVDGVTPRAIAEWDKHDGYVIGVQVPDGTAGIVRLIERSTHPTIPIALRELAKLIEHWETAH